MKVIWKIIFVPSILCCCCHGSHLTTPTPFFLSRAPFSSTCRYQFRNTSTGELTWEAPLQTPLSPGEGRSGSKKFPACFGFLFVLFCCLFPNLLLVSLDFVACFLILLLVSCLFCLFLAFLLLVTCFVSCFALFCLFCLCLSFFP